MQKLTKILFPLSVILLLMDFSLFYLLPVRPIYTYTVIYISSSVLFLILTGFILNGNFSRNFILTILIAGIIVKIGLINLPTIGSDDIFRYMWDGKVQSAGINPYKFAPDSAPLQSLHSDLLPKAVNFPNLKSIYFPLSQWIFYTGYSLSGESVWGYKLLLLFAELLTLFALYKLLKKLNKPLKLILLYALCPLTVMQFAVDAHLDGFGLPLLLWALYFYLDEKKFLSMVLLGLSFSIKPLGLLLIPLLLNEKGIKSRLMILTVPAAAFLLQFVPYVFSSNPFESLFIFAKNWTFNGIVFTILNYFIANNQITRIICGILFIAGFGTIALKKNVLIHKLYYSILLLFIFSPVVHPWYISWLVILLPLHPKWSGLLLASLSSLTVLTVMTYQTTGLWQQYPMVLAGEYLPVIIFLIFELTRPHSFRISSEQAVKEEARN